jgi:hypothetical protein
VSVRAYAFARALAPAHVLVSALAPARVLVRALAPARARVPVRGAVQEPVRVLVLVRVRESVSVHGRVPVRRVPAPPPVRHGSPRCATPAQ